MTKKITTDNINNWQHLDLAHEPGACEGNDRCRVLLVAINVPGHYSLPVRILALMANQSQELSTKFDVRYLEFLNNEDPVNIAKAVVNQCPKLVGFSVNIWNRDITFSVLERLKQTHAGMKTLVGGQEVSNSMVDYLADNLAIDYLIDGEGELPFMQFLETWSQTENGLQDPDQVSGLRYRQADTVVATRPAEIIPSLDDIPSPILAGMVAARKDYQLGIMLEGARGCPFKCSFCFEGGRKIKVRTTSIQRLQSEAIKMAEQGATYFHIMDPILGNSDPVRLERLTAIFDKLTSINAKIVSSVEAYAHQITLELAAFFRCFTIVDVGLQTAHPETARAIHRPWRPEKFKQGLAHLRQAQVPYNLYLICGLPYETLASYLNGIRSVISEQPTRIFLNELCILNGTELRRQSHEYEYVFDKRPPYTLRASKWMSKLELQFAEVLSKIVQRHYNLSAKAVHTTAPWLPKTAPHYGRHVAIRLDAPCSVECKGCDAATQSQTRPPENLETILAGAMDIDADIITGDQVDTSFLMRLVGQLTLAGAARIRLVGPMSLFAHYDLLQKLVNRGVWHYCTFDSLDKDIGDASLLETRELVMTNFANTFSLIGHADIQPALEVIMLFNNTTGYPRGTRQQFEHFFKLRPTTIWTIPDCGPAIRSECDFEFKTIFWEGIQFKNWLKLPVSLFQSMLSASGLDNNIASQCEALKLTSRAPNRPPCFWKAKP